MPQVINTVTKASPTDNYPVVKDTDLSGSYRIVDNITERDAIVSSQRKQSMLVFVISDLHFYQLQSDLLTWTDLGLSLGGGGGSSLPIVHQVYLVEDASDAILMGGVTSNVYTTAQAAYNAADILSAGGTIPVVIMVGKTTAAVVGSITLTTDWNSAISLSGISSFDSAIDQIIGDNNLGTAFGATLNITNLTIQMITCQGTGVVGDGGFVQISGTGYDIFYIYTGTTGVGATGGSLVVSNQTFFSQTGNNRIRTIDMTVTDPTGGLSGDIYLEDDTLYVNQLFYSAANSFGSLSLYGCTLKQINVDIISGGGNVVFKRLKNEQMFLNYATPTSFFIFDCSLGNVTFGATTGGADMFMYDTSFNESLIIGGAILDFTDITSGYRLKAYNCNFGRIANLPTGAKIFDSSIIRDIATLGTGISVINTSITGNPIASAPCITNATAVNVIFDNSTYTTAPNTTITFTRAASVIPKTRYVYLVQDAADLLAMGDRHNNVYTTFQAAYDAANALQISLGITQRVVLQVGNTTAATVGNLSITTAFNGNINIVGISRTASVVGSMTSTATSGTSTIRAQNITIGAITNTSATVGTLSVTLILAAIGVLSYSNPTCILNMTNSTSSNIIPSGAAISLQISGSNSNITQINHTTTSTNTINITWSNCFNMFISNQTLVSDTGNVGNITITASLGGYYGIINMTNNSTITGVNVGTLFVNGSRDTGFGNVTIRAQVATSGVIGGLRVDDISDATFSQPVIIQAASALPASDVIVSNVVINKSTLTQLIVNHVGGSTATGAKGGVVTTFKLDSCNISDYLRVSYSSLTYNYGTGNFNINNCIFPGLGINSGVGVFYDNVTLSSFVFKDSSISASGVAGLPAIGAGFVITTSNLSGAPFLTDPFAQPLHILRSTLASLYISYIGPGFDVTPGYDIKIEGSYVPWVAVTFLTPDAQILIRGSQVPSDYTIDPAYGLFIDDISGSSSGVARSSVENSTVNLSGVALAGVPVNMLYKNSAIGGYISPTSYDIISYLSSIDFTLSIGVIANFNGTLYTSNAIIPVVSINGFTNNNSAIQTI